MATFRFELNARPNTHKKYAVYLRVTVAGQRKLIKTLVEVDKPSHFNAKCKGENWIRKNVLDSQSLNEELARVLEKAKDTYRDLDDDGNVTSHSVAAKMNNERQSSSFLEYARERTQMIYDTGEINTWKKYVTALNKLDDFKKKQRMLDIRFEDLTVSFITKFENFLRKSKNSRDKDAKQLLHPNTIHAQLKVVKALVRRAVGEGLMDVSKNPFLTFKLTTVKTVKEKLEKDELQKIIDLDLPTNSRQWDARNCFLFSYYCAGIRAGDLLQLRWANITSGNRLIYQMGKNHKERDLMLIAPAIDILRHYRTEKSKPTDYIFPFLSSAEPYAKYITQSDKDRMNPELCQLLYKNVAAKNALLNKYLKEIAAKAEITKTISMHISRHSFAHIAAGNGVNSVAIKNILGHSNLATTEKYMGEFDTTQTDNTLLSVFEGNHPLPSLNPDKSDTSRTAPDSIQEPSKSKEEQAIELLKGMSPAQIMSIIAALNK